MNYEVQIKKLLNITIKEKASDLHISVGHKPILRITRKLIRLEKEETIISKDSEGLAFALMNEKQKEKLLREKEIDFAYDFDSIARFRVNVFFQSGSISIALRLIPAKIKTIEELNLPSILHRFSKARQGFVLITGASSQGKSTTLACLINEINNDRAEHIITIENPIEYVFEDNKSIIDQREVYQDTLSFSRALRSTLREDPNVIMVGELRDLETITTAITAAETGHLVFATLHTNSASQTIHRIVDVFPSFQQNQIRAQLAGSLLGIISQRLVPQIGEGFIPACEIMFANSAVNNLIRENKIHEIPSVIETSRKDGMISLNQSLYGLVVNKKISPETALKYSLNPKDLISRLKK
ncbi:type IV pilus twitching motility protein PilT [Candidatus Atribacteria bacterium MT.SAG.1]|nr:type IV pilus twitching motility protein PilT [Candidatus Atribacteria bacterium MT.SAG.1]